MKGTAVAGFAGWRVSRRVSFEQLESAVTHYGLSLAELSDTCPTVVLFLRQLGSPLARAGLADVQRCRGAFKQSGRHIVLVHTGAETPVQAILERYGLTDLPRIADPGGQLYEAFGLLLARKRRMLHPVACWRMLTAALWHGAGRAMGNRRQLGGAFLIYRGELVASFRHARLIDRPDLSLLSGCPVGDE